MNQENFCFWLQGWLEIQNPNKITIKQLNEIKNHLSLAMNNNISNNQIPTSQDWRHQLYC